MIAIQFTKVILEEMAGNACNTATGSLCINKSMTSYSNFCNQTDLHIWCRCKKPEWYFSKLKNL